MKASTLSALGILVLALLTGAACSELSGTPARMSEFVALHKTLLKTYQNGTSVQKDNISDERKKALADYLAKGADFTDWPVVVQDVRIEGDSQIGKLVVDKPAAVLTVTFDGITLENSFAKILMDTPANIIAKDSPLHATVTGLQKGQKIKVSGSFVPKDGLPRELSLTTSGALETPEYVVIFTAVKP